VKGFKDLATLKAHHQLRPSSFLYPDEVPPPPLLHPYETLPYMRVSSFLYPDEVPHPLLPSPFWLVLLYQIHVSSLLLPDKELPLSPPLSSSAKETPSEIQTGCYGRTKV